MIGGHFLFLWGVIGLFQRVHTLESTARHSCGFSNVNYITLMHWLNAVLFMYGNAKVMSHTLLLVLEMRMVDLCNYICFSYVPQICFSAKVYTFLYFVCLGQYKLYLYCILMLWCWMLMCVYSAASSSCQLLCYICFCMASILFAFFCINMGI